MGFSRQEYWSGLPCPPPGDVPDPVTEPRSPAFQADSLPAELPGKPKYICMHTKSLQSCLTLCDPMDSSPPSSSVYGILQARILEWVAISFSNACLHVKLLQSCPTLCNPMDSSPPRLLSMGFSRQEYWSGLPFPSPPSVCVCVCVCVYIYTHTHTGVVCHFLLPQVCVYIFIYLFWLCWVFIATWAFSSCSERGGVGWGLLFVAKPRLLIMVVSLITEHGFQGTRASVVFVPGL